MPISDGGYEVVAPAGLLSTDTYVALGAIDMRPWKSLSYTLKVATNALKWTVYGANLADYSDEVVVQAEASVAVGAIGSYSTTQAVWARYRVKIKADVGGSQGTGTLNGIAKP